MSAAPDGVVIAEFGNPGALCHAARRMREEGFRLLDALTPCPLQDLDEPLSLRPSPIRWPMLIAAVGVAAFAYWLEWWSAVFAYPIDSGGRPLHSWPVFLLAPFEVGVLAAGLAGFVALLVLCGLPRLNHPLFDWDAIERASDDRYFLLMAAPGRESDNNRLRGLLSDLKALRIRELPA